MSHVVWTRRPLPALPREAPAWEWPLCTPVDVTLGRRQLQTDLQRRLPPGADHEDLDRLLLVFEELASNGVRHGRSPVRVRVTPTASGWLIDVCDAALEQPPLPAVGRDPADGGLGLYLVAALCAAHGWTVRRDGKHVWACV